MEFLPRGRPYFRGPADPDADGWRSWTSSLGVPRDRCRQEAHQRRYARATCSSARACKITSAATLARVRGQVCEGENRQFSVKTLFVEPLLTRGRMAQSRASFVLLRDELLQREAFDKLLEANGALRAVAAAHQHDPVAQCLGLPAQNPNLKKASFMGVGQGRCDWVEPRVQRVSKRVSKKLT